ncbi:MAG TPA: hypothetical protein VMT68_12770 [Caulobacteraceae bacterium]|nr:hypothetical protein [Caulobacteraceae bacterium]
MRRFIRAAAPSVGYGLTLLATLFLGNIGLLLVTLAHPETAAGGRFAQVLAFAIVGGLAGIFTGLNINKSHPLADRSAILWIWLLGLPVARRLAEIVLAVRWDQSLMIEAALLGGAAAIVMMGAGRLAPERAP